MSFRSILSGSANSQGRISKTYRRRGRRHVTLEPLEKRSLLSAAPNDAAAAVTDPAIPVEIGPMDPVDNTTLAINYGDGDNQASFLMNKRDPADGSVDSIFSQYDQSPSEITDAQRDAARQAALDARGSAVLGGFTHESGVPAGSHVALNRYVFTVEQYDFVNNAPVANAGGDYHLHAGDSLILDASASSDADQDQLSYSWDVNGDGVFGDATGATPTLSWEDLQNLQIENGGNYQVTVQVDDGYGGVAQQSAGLTVENAAPTASIDVLSTASDGGYLEGSTIKMEGIAEDADPQDALALSWNVLKNGQAYATGAGQDFSFTPDDNGSYDVTLTVTDSQGATAASTKTLEVGNVAPTAQITGTPDDSPEGAEISLGSAIADPGTLDTHTLDWKVTKDGQDYASGSGADFKFTPDDNGSYQVSLTATDNDGGVGSAVSTIEVTNVAPAIAGMKLDGPAIAENGQVSLNGSFTDPSLADTHTLDIAWGDGTTSQASVDPASRTFSASHQYAGGGVFQIGTTLRDDDGGSDDASATAYVTGMGVRNGTLEIVGTNGNDFVYLDKLCRQYMVTADFLPSSHPMQTINSQGIKRIEMYLGDGNDRGVVSRSVHSPAIVDGGMGDDYLVAGDGRTVLMGDEGDDVLVAGRGRDLLIGGPGSDWIAGASPKDVFMGNGRRDNVNDTALLALVNDWV